MKITFIIFIFTFLIIQALAQEKDLAEGSGVQKTDEQDLISACAETQGLMRKVHFRGLRSEKIVEFTEVNEQFFCKRNEENGLSTQTLIKMQNDESDPGPCLEAFFQVCFSEFFLDMIDALGKHHIFLLENIEDYPDAFSLELMPHIAANPSESLNALPRIRGSWGIFSTDVRLNYMTGFRTDHASINRMLEWQTLQMNTYPGKNFNMRFGIGILYNFSDDRLYNEDFAGFEAYFMQHKLTVVAEGRFACDYEAYQTIFGEVNVRANLLFMKNKHFDSYIMAGGLYQHYGGIAEYKGFQAGLYLSIH